MTTTETAQEKAWEKFPNDAAEILERSEAPNTRCRRHGCQQPIWWGITAKNRKRCPFDIKPDGSRTGTSHWRTCLDRPGKP